MATRRLLAILLVMLFLSSLIAALAPMERGITTTSSTTSTTTTPQTDTGSGALLQEKISTSNERPPRIKAQVGDQLQLRVDSRSEGTIEIGGLGLTEDVDPQSPARFDVLLEEENTYPVRFLGKERAFAFIEVTKRSAPDAGRPSD